jgi:thiol-disulfide isomerase/thioredoxin
MKFKKLILYVFIVLLIEVATAFIRYRSLKADFCISFVIFFTIVFFLIKKEPKHKKAILLSFLAAIIGLQALVWILDGKFPMVGATNTVGTIIATIAAYIYSNSNLFTRRSILIFCTSICIFYFVRGHMLWIHYLNYGNLTGQMFQKVPENWLGSLASADSNNKRVLERKLVVLDFYNTSCVVCFRKFPLLQKLTDKYKNLNSIGIAAVNIPLERDTIGMAQYLVRSKGYSFPIIVAQKCADSVFKILAFPTTIIIKGGDVIYKGNIEGAEEIVEKQLTIIR